MLKKKGKEKKIGSMCISKEFKINLMKLTLSVTFIWRNDRKIYMKN